MSGTVGVCGKEGREKFDALRRRYSDETVSTILGVTRATLRQWRIPGRLPQHVGLACEWLLNHPEPRGLELVQGEELDKLRRKIGGWRPIAEALGVTPSTLSRLANRTIRGAYLYAIRQISGTPYKGDPCECYELGYLVTRYGLGGTAEILGVSARTVKNWHSGLPPAWAQRGIREGVSRKAARPIGPLTPEEAREVRALPGYPQGPGRALGVDPYTLTGWVDRKIGGVKRAAICSLLSCAERNK